MVLQMTLFCSFLWLTNIPLYMYHFFSVVEHLGCFRVLAIVNSAAENPGLYASFQIMVFSGCVPRSEIAG